MVNGGTEGAKLTLVTDGGTRLFETKASWTAWRINSLIDVESMALSMLLFCTVVVLFCTVVVSLVVCNGTLELKLTVVELELLEITAGETIDEEEVSGVGGWRTADERVS